jgi:hypothetical protein
MVDPGSGAETFKSSDKHVACALLYSTYTESKTTCTTEETKRAFFFIKCFYFFYCYEGNTICVCFVSNNIEGGPALEYAKIVGT